MKQNNGKPRLSKLLKSIDRMSGALTPHIGPELCRLAEISRKLPPYPTPKEFMAMSEQEYKSHMAVRMAAEDAMPWFWREVYVTGCNLVSIEINLDDLRRLEYWRNIYLPTPTFLFETLLETVCLALFGNIWGVVYKAKILRWFKYIDTTS